MGKPILDTEVLLSTYEERIWGVLERVKEWAKISHVLIVHQTKNKDLIKKISQQTSKIDNVKYIVQAEYGVSKSRNLAISKSTGNILLFADDDIELSSDFSSKLVKAYEVHPDADVITFPVKDINSEKLTKNFPKTIMWHNKISILKVGTIEISLRRKILENGARFPEDLGAGANLPLCDEPVFLSRLIDKGGSLLYIPDVIASHPIDSSGRYIDEYNKLKSRYVAFHYMYGWGRGRVFFLLFSLKNFKKIERISWVVDCLVGR